jgi:histidinol-phosphatase (PHP family)
VIDYHVHSDCSGDCSAPMLDVCRAATGRGIETICFTEHIDFEPTDLCYGTFDYAGYKSRIAEAQEAFAGVLDIRCGVEVDFAGRHRAQIEDFLAEKEFDYVLGATHYVGRVILEDHERYFPGKSAQEAYTPFFDNTLETVQTGWFDTVAHLDLCKRYGVHYLGAFDWEPHRERIEQILREVIERDMALEINTSGLRQLPGETYPCRQILEGYYALGGRAITVGSDAHYVGDVGRGIPQALEMARDVGFEHVRVFKAREGTPVPISAAPR